MFNLFLSSAIEQFEILPIFKINFMFLDLSITNSTVMLFFILYLSYSCFFMLVEQSTNTLYIIPTRAQVIFEQIYLMLLIMVMDNIAGKKSQLFFPLIFSTFFFIVCLNLIGLVPYSFTVTTHCVITLSVSLTLFIGMNILAIKNHGLEVFSLFLPKNTSVALSILLVPVEFISYIFKPLSLSIRLFCNMMAGHTLFKVFSGFAWSLMRVSGLAFFAHIFPLILIFLLYFLEFGVALIQAFVFCLLTCIYLNDAINLHHQDEKIEKVLEYKSFSVDKEKNLYYVSSSCENKENNLDDEEFMNNAIAKKTS